MPNNVNQQNFITIDKFAKKEDLTNKNPQALTTKAKAKGRNGN